MSVTNDAGVFGAFSALQAEACGQWMMIGMSWPRELMTPSMNCGAVAHA
jgi:hypothetical protein